MKTLDELINKASKEGKWLHCNYQNLWFSPAELREQNLRGYFQWGPNHFRLRDPQEELLNLKEKVIVAEKNVINFQARMNNG